MRNCLIIIISSLSLHLFGVVGFVVNSGSETLSRIDFETGEVNNTFCTLGSMPNRVGLTPEYAYVVNSGDNSIQKIDLTSGTTISNIYIENSSNPYDIIINEDYAYVTGGLINKVYQIDLTTDTVIAYANVGGNPAGMAILNGKLYIGNSDYGTGYSNCSVSVVNLGSFSVEATIPVEVNPQFLSVINEKIHVSCGGDWITTFGKICIIEPSSNSVTNILDMGGVTSNLSLMPNNRVYIGDGFGISLYAYNSETFEIIYDNSNPFTPGGTMVTSNDENLFVLGGEWGQNFSVKVFDVNENLTNEYIVGLYATDIKLVNDEVSVNEQTIPHSSIQSYNISNYPNPFKPSGAGRGPGTTIKLDLAESGKIELEIYNIKGQKVKTLLDAYSSKEHFEIIWRGTDDSKKKVSSGNYFIKLKVNGEEKAVSKCILLK
ncbi:MAG: T9SS type A sorting domain-containing protein [Candidatus Cloacimonetes bacterium]|nr:T9SS type A sorting domain-containing protein [Candidatus Cloacimonadota bacterium]